MTNIVYPFQCFHVVVFPLLVFILDFSEQLEETFYIIIILLSHTPI